ncbi:MAG TPA: YHS domain-containing protein, partial [Gemmataceae bacterium]|nr:YHS domain-containing protein [Gemmataceae bacterium]
MNLTLLQPAAVDPVCGMQVNPATAAGKTDYKGQTYYFCNPRCLTKFQQNPEKYLAHPGSETHDASADVSGAQDYVCPMDPEVHSDHPGACPKCGMALEPRFAAPDAGPNLELLAMTWRFWLSLACGLPLLVNAMSGMVLAHPLLPHGWWELLLAFVVAGIGLPLFTRAGASVVRLSPNMFTLIGLG